jgi:hypothetical protein
MLSLAWLPGGIVSVILYAAFVYATFSISKYTANSGYTFCDVIS